MSKIPARLEVALLLPPLGAPPPSGARRIAEELARGLEARGHRVTVITADGSARDADADVGRPRRLVEAGLRARGFPPRLTRIPIALGALRGSDFHVLHAFSALDAQVALLARHVGRTGAVFTCVEPPTREHLAERRLSLAFARRAFLGSDAVVGAGAEAQRAIERWLALEVETIDGADAEAYEAVYLRCLRRSL